MAREDGACHLAIIKSLMNAARILILAALTFGVARMLTAMHELCYGGRGENLPTPSCVIEQSAFLRQSVSNR